MVKAELVENNSAIQISLDQIGRAYIAARFVESASPTGKLVRFQKVDSPAIKGWTNMVDLNGYRKLPWSTAEVGVIDQEYARFYTTSGEARLLINVLKADNRTVAIGDYTPHTPDTAATVLLDTKIAEDQRRYGLQVQQ